jgi:segregation and condensation protein B
MQNSAEQKETGVLVPEEELSAALEAILFVAGEAVDMEDIAKGLEIDKARAAGVVDALEQKLDGDMRGLTLKRFGNKVQIATRRRYADVVQKFMFTEQRQSLSQSALETLSIVAYKQPITRAEIEQVRGVRCEYSVSSLVAKGLIGEVGRKDALGRPILYGTTDAFLRHFALESLDDLPHKDTLDMQEAMEETKEIIG